LQVRVVEAQPAAGDGAAFEVEHVVRRRRAEGERAAVAGVDAVARDGPAGEGEVAAGGQRLPRRDADRAAALGDGGADRRVGVDVDGSGIDERRGGAGGDRAHAAGAGVEVDHTG